MTNHGFGLYLFWPAAYQSPYSFISVASIRYLVIHRVFLIRDRRHVLLIEFDIKSILTKFKMLQDKPSQNERAKAKKTDDLQPDDEEIEEEFEVEETESKPATRPASKLDLEEPISNSQNEEDENEDEDEEEVNSKYKLLYTLLQMHLSFQCKILLFFLTISE